MPAGYDLYRAKDGTATDNRGRGIYPDPDVERRGKANRGRLGTSRGRNIAGGIFNSIPYLRRLLGEEQAAGTDSIDDILAALGLGEGGLGGSSSSSTVVVPPVLDVLAEMRARRQAAAEQAATLAGIIGTNVPQGMEYYPGAEPGGVADVLLGIITGKGPGAAGGIMPYDQRRVNRVNIPVPNTNPSVGDELGEASGIANQILNAIRVIQTGSSSG